LEINFKHMRRAWDPQQPVETLFKQIQDCADYSETGGVPIDPSQQINIGYAKIFATGHFMSACRRWNEKPAAEKTWTHFKSHFAAAHRQNKQMQGESAASAGYHSANAAMTQSEDQMAEATIGALANLETVNTSGKAGAQIPPPPWEMILPLGEIMQYVCNLTRLTRLSVTSHSQPLINAK
jgi:hypothetical protein